MAFFPLRCSCGASKELCCLWIQKERNPEWSRCQCGEMMETDWSRMNGKVTFRSKGIFPLTDENLGPEPVVVTDHAHLRRELKARGLHIKDRNPEANYRAKHIKDIVR